jgi:hypothetical protein
MQVLVTVSQYCFVAQSPSTLHPEAGRQVPFTEQTPLWQAPGLVTVHEPWPLANPQALFVVSQKPLAQTEVPTAVLQTPVSGGVWPPTVGIGVPFTSCATQAPASHHCVAVQLPSATQALPQAPLASQMPPAWVAPAAVQVVIAPAVPQVAQAPPPPGQ